MLRAGLTLIRKIECLRRIDGQAARRLDSERIKPFVDIAKLFAEM
jgi:hypothetical protein